MAQENRSPELPERETPPWLGGKFLTSINLTRGPAAVVAALPLLSGAAQAFNSPAAAASLQPLAHQQQLVQTQVQHAFLLAARKGPVTDEELRAAYVKVAHSYVKYLDAAKAWHLAGDADPGPGANDWCDVAFSDALHYGALSVGARSPLEDPTGDPYGTNPWVFVRVNPGPAGVISSQEKAQQLHRWHSIDSGYKPKPGDGVVFHGHIEMVWKIEGGVLYTFGGNAGSSLSDIVDPIQNWRTSAGIVGFIDTGLHGSQGNSGHSGGQGNSQPRPHPKKSDNGQQGQQPGPGQTETPAPSPSTSAPTDQPSADNPSGVVASGTIPGVSGDSILAAGSSGGDASGGSGNGDQSAQVSATSVIPGIAAVAVPAAPTGATGPSAPATSDAPSTQDAPSAPESSSPATAGPSDSSLIGLSGSTVEAGGATPTAAPTIAGVTADAGDSGATATPQASTPTAQPSESQSAAPKPKTQPQPHKPNYSAAHAKRYREITTLQRAIAYQESRGDPRAASQYSTATGEYQEIDTTWSTAKHLYPEAVQYQTAAAAPKYVQDAVAYLQISQLYDQYHGDLQKVAISWMLPSAADTGANIDTNYSGITPRQYGASVMGHYHDIAAHGGIRDSNGFHSLPLKLTGPGLDKLAAKTGSPLPPPPGAQRTAPKPSTQPAKPTAVPSTPAPSTAPSSTAPTPETSVPAGSGPVASGSIPGVTSDATATDQGSGGTSSEPSSAPTVAPSPSASATAPSSAPATSASAPAGQESSAGSADSAPPQAASQIPGVTAADNGAARTTSDTATQSAVAGIPAATKTAFRALDAKGALQQWHTA